MKVVLFHTNCTDGLFAAFSLWMNFGKDALYIPVNYKPIQDLEPQQALDYIFSEATGKRVDSAGNSIFKVTDVTPEMYKEIDLYVVDYSFPVTHFLEHSAQFNSVTVLDHHEKAIVDYTNVFGFRTLPNGWKEIIPFDNTKIVFSETESGAKLTWRYLHPDEPVPYYIELVSDRDLFTFQLEHTRSFHAGIRGIGERNFSKIKQVIDEQFDELNTIGGHFERANASRINSIRDNNTKLITIKIDGEEFKAGLVNSYPDMASDLCASVIKTNNYPIAIAYNVYSDGGVGCSIRSNNKTALRIGERLGGGGHANASGFHITFKQLNEIMETGVLSV